MFIDQWLDTNDYIVAHTSGSTGTPKPIRLLKTDMMLSARATIAHFGLNADSTLVLPLSDDYIAGKMMIVRSQVLGARLIVEPPSRRPLATDPGCTVNLIAIVPQQIDGLIASPAHVCSAIVGGAPVSPDEERRALDMRPDIVWWATYGMTETCSHVALRRFGSDTYHALPGITFATDERGCLVISNPYASWSPLVTNDIVTLVSPHAFRWHGRADNVIISGGLKLHPEEIERHLAGILSPGTYYIAPRPSREWGTEAILVVQGGDDQELANHILTEARRVLPSHMCPKDVVFIPEIQRTSTGKIRRIPVRGSN